MDKELKKQIIIDNYEEPYNKCLLHDKSYTNLLADNVSCIDKFNIEIKIDNDVISDIHFDGEGCAISTSSTSIMIKLFIGKTIDEALEIIDNFEKMTDEKEYNVDILEEANAYSDIYKEPARIKCAVLPYKTLKEYFLKLKR